jgi:hypothetical protein
MEETLLRVDSELKDHICIDQAKQRLEEAEATLRLLENEPSLLICRKNANAKNDNVLR